MAISNRNRRPVEQPFRGFLLDKDSPFLEGLVAWLPANGHYFDPARGVRLVPEVNTTQFVFVKHHLKGAISVLDWVDAGTSGVDGQAIPFLPEFTLCVSAYVDNTNRADGYYNLISRGGVFVNNSNFSFGFRLATGSFRRPYCYGRNSSTLVGFEITNSVSIGWHRLVVTWRSGSQVAYVDGVQYGTASQTNGANGSQNLYFGRPSSTAGGDLYWRAGQAHDFRVYRRVWSKAEVEEDWIDQFQIFSAVKHRPRTPAAAPEFNAAWNSAANAVIRGMPL